MDSEKAHVVRSQPQDMILVGSVWYGVKGGGKPDRKRLI